MADLPDRLPRHVAIIMDGNGRWAGRRGLPRREGHRAGGKSARVIAEACIELGIPVLTLYAFSTENWTRPQPEVQALLRLFSRFVRRELDNLDRNGVRLQVLGHPETLPGWLQRQVEDAVARTTGNRRMTLNICFSYGGRDDIVGAVRQVMAAGLDPSEVTEEVFSGYLATDGMPDPDLVIRTAGDLRISNFLLWQCAYAELYFTDAYWPDFGREDIDMALADYARRKRKFGGLPPEDVETFGAV